MSRSYLKAELTDAGYVQLDVAKIAGVDPSTVSRWFRGHISNNPAIESAVRELINSPK